MSAFRGAGGKVSMTRIVVFMLAADATALAGALVYYLVRGEPKPEASVLGASAAVVGAFVAGGAVAIINRSRGAVVQKTVTPEAPVSVNKLARS